MKNKKLVDFSKIPSKPGVYFFKNKQGKVIYVGKALSLKSRLRSYFQKNLPSSKVSQMVQEVASLDFIETQSDFEALLLEAKLIKQYQPKYNTRLKDNKRYLYIAISRSPFPRLYIVRRPELEKDLLDWFGPFPSSQAARSVLRTIRNVFPYCSCRRPRSSCLYVHLGLCPGPEKAKTKKYRQTIEKIRKILNGNISFLVGALKKKMEKAIAEEAFEKAAKIKKQLDDLLFVTRRHHFLDDLSLNRYQYLDKQLRKMLLRYQNQELFTIQKIEGYDVSNLGHGVIVGAMVAFVNGEPEKTLYRKFNIKSFLHKKGRTARENDPEGIKQILCRRLNHPEWIYPQLILIDGGKTQVSAAFAALKEKNLHHQIGLIGLAKKEETLVIPFLEKGKISRWHLIKLSSRSPVLRLLQQIRDESHRFAQKYYREVYKKTLVGK